jgi:hypothetical protein
MNKHGVLGTAVCFFLLSACASESTVFDSHYAETEYEIVCVKEATVGTRIKKMVCRQEGPPSIALNPRDFEQITLPNRGYLPPVNQNGRTIPQARGGGAGD